MTGALPTLGLIAAAWLGFAALTSLVVTIGWRTASAWRSALHPRRRAEIALSAAVAPSAMPTLLVLVCLAPGLTALLGHGDHCLGHGDHPHLCLVHWTGALQAPVVAILALAASVVGLVLAKGGVTLLRTRRVLSALRATGASGPCGTFSVAPSTLPFSLAAGFGRREVWVSSALAEALSPRELEVVILHERAHLERRDPLRRTAAELLSFPLWPSVRRAILAELALATEQACDERAAERAGSRLAVAETLLAVERLAGSASPTTPYALPAFGGPHVEARVQSLLGDPRHDTSSRWVAWAAAAGVPALLWLAADPLHHLTEHWLRLLLRLG